MEMISAYRTILRCLGEDPDRAGLRDTPERAAKAMRAMTAGYSESPRDVAGTAMFDVYSRAAGAEQSGMVLVRDIRINSLCEHHLLPFFGRAHIAYVPDGNSVLGLSKLARIADCLARRLSMQERLTSSIADAIMDVARARGVAVVVECAHLCMCARGVKQPDATTRTAAWRGEFESDASLKEEFWHHLGGASRL